MKTIAGYIARLICVAALMAATSCSQEVKKESVRLSDTSIVLQNGELTYQFDVVSNAHWTLECLDADGSDADWFCATPSSGNGTTRVTLNIIKENPGLANRSGKIIVTGADSKSEATVMQRGLSRVISFVDPQIVAVSSSATAGRFTLVLSSGGATVTAKLPSDAPWLSNLKLIEDVDTGSSIRKTWSFDVASNNLSDMRSATAEVSVSAKGKTDVYAVRIEQRGQGVPAIKTPDVVYMGSNQATHTQPFWVEGSKENLTYQISCSSASMDTGEAWITDARVEGENLVITAAPNTFSESREGSVYIVGTRASAAGSGASTALSVKVYQAGHTSAGIQMAASEVSVGYAAASHFVSFILLNGSKISGNPEANVPWITDIKASEEGRLAYSVSAYNAASDESDYREGIISFRLDNGSSNEALASLKVRQYSSIFADIVLPSEISLQARSASAIIPFNADGGKLEVVGSGADWLNAVCAGDGALSVIKLTAADWAAGDVGAALRSGVLALKYTKNERSVYHYVNVYQYAPAVRDITVPEAVNLDYDEEKANIVVGLGGGRLGEISCTSSGDWIKGASVSGAGDLAEITVTVEKWSEATSGTANRSGMLCVPYINDGLTMYHYIQVSQRSQVFSDIVLPSNVNLRAKSGAETIPFDADGGTLEVVDSGSDWIKATCAKQSGLSIIKVSASDWSAGDADIPMRSGLVTLKYSKNGMSAYHYVTVSQFAPAVRDITVPEAVNLDYDEEKANIVVGLGGGRLGEISCTSSGDWIKGASVSGAGDLAEITVTVEKWSEATSGTANRSGMLCVPYINDGLTMYHYIQINQKSQAFKDIALPDEVSLPAKWAYELIPYELDGGTLEIVKDAAGSWLETADMHILSDTFLIVSAEDWQASDADSDLRSGLIILKYTKDGMSAYHYLTVKQFAPKVRDITVPSAINIDYDETSASFRLALNGGKIGDISYSSAGDWIRKVRTVKNGDNEVDVVVETDSWKGSGYVTSDRTGTLCIPYRYDGLTLYHYVVISQKPEPFSDIYVPGQLNLRQLSEPFTFYLDASKGRIGNVASSADWLTVSSATNKGVCAVTITASSLNADDPTRHCFLTVPYTMNGVAATYYIDVTQFSRTMSALSSYPKIMTLSYSQTHYESSAFNTLESGCSLGKAYWDSDTGWLTSAKTTGTGGVVGEKLLLESEAWDKQSSSPFRMGLVSFPFSRTVGCVTHTVYYHIPVYQYSDSAVGINIPTNIGIEPYDTSTTIELNGVEGATLTAFENADWITSVEASPTQVVIHTTTAFIRESTESSRSSVITFTYTLNGFATSYTMTVTQNIITEPSGYIDNLLKGYVHYDWRDSATEDPQYRYSSFNWLDSSARTKEAKLYFLGVSSSFDYLANNQNITCSDGSLFKLKMTACEAKPDSDGNMYMVATIQLTEPDFRNWVQGKAYSIDIAIDGGTLTVPLPVEVYEYKPVRPIGLQPLVPNVAEDLTDSYGVPFSLDNLPAPDGEHFTDLVAGDFYSDKECTVPITSGNMTGKDFSSEGSTYRLHVSYKNPHDHEEGYLKVTLKTSSGKSEDIAVPYRLYTRVTRRNSLPSLTRGALSYRIPLEQLFLGYEDWEVKSIHTSDSRVGISVSESTLLINVNIIYSLTFSSLPITFHLALKPSVAGDGSRVSDVTELLVLEAR